MSDEPSPSFVIITEPAGPPPTPARPVLANAGKGELQDDFNAIETVMARGRKVPTAELTNALTNLRPSDFEPATRIKILKFVASLHEGTQNTKRIAAINQIVKHWFFRTNPDHFNAQELVEIWPIITYFKYQLTIPILAPWQARMFVLLGDLGAQDIETILRGFRTSQYLPRLYLREALQQRLLDLINQPEINVAIHLDCLSHLADIGINLHHAYLVSLEGRVNQRLEQLTSRLKTQMFYAYALADRPPPQWLIDAALTLLIDQDSLTEHQFDELFAGIANFKLRDLPAAKSFPWEAYAVLKKQVNIETSRKLQDVRDSVFSSLAKELGREVHTDVFLQRIMQRMDIVESRVVVEILGPEHYIFWEGKDRVRPSIKLSGRILNNSGKNHFRIKWKDWATHLPNSDKPRSKRARERLEAFRARVIKELGDIILLRPRTWRRPPT